MVDIGEVLDLLGICGTVDGLDSGNVGIAAEVDAHWHVSEIA